MSNSSINTSFKVDADEVNGKYKQFSEQFNIHLTNSIKVVQQKSRINTPMKPWVDQTLLSAINAKNFWHKKMNDNKTQHSANPHVELNEKLSIEYEYWRRQVENSKKESHKNYYSQKVQTSLNNPSKA